MRGGHVVQRFSKLGVEGELGSVFEEDGVAEVRGGVFGLGEKVDGLQWETTGCAYR